MTDASPLVAGADRAAASGDLAGARDLLERALGEAPDDPALLLRLAGLQRAGGMVAEALASVERALAASPLDFTALLMRASLLERLGRSDSDGAWRNALACRPPEVPAHLAGIVAQAEQKVERWNAERDERMERAAAAATGSATDDERRRFERFRGNRLRRTRPFHSEPTDFHYPGLREREFHDRGDFPWLDRLEAATDTIAGELQQVMAAERAELVPYVQYDAHLPMDQWRPLNHNPDWTAIHLLRQGARVEANARHCPRTLALLDAIGQPVIAGASPNAMFSLLAPRTSIPPHVGINNSRLVCHLPLVVPPGCWFRVGAETRHWQRGSAFVFDDTIEHEALNPSDELRIVLIFDVWHPDLSEAERAGVAAMIGCEATGGGL